MATNNNTSTTQTFLDIHDISNNFVILKDGTVSIILTINAMNFGLLAEAEQDAVIYSYAALLNSLNYPIQILIQSKTKDATTYLNRLKDQEAKITSPDKRERIARYRQFVSELIKERNVLDKKFYVAVPASATELGLISVSSVIPGNTKFDINSVEKLVLLEKAASVLEPKRDHLIAQFNRIGLYARQLNTQEIIQVFYNNYNPESYEGQEITDSNNYTTPLVQAQIIGGNMNFSSPNLNQVASNQAIPPTAPVDQAMPPVTPAMPTQTTPPTLPMTPPAGMPNPSTSVSPPSPVMTTPLVPQASVNVQEPIASLQIPQAEGTTPPVAAPQPGTDVNTPAMTDTDQLLKTDALEETITPVEPTPETQSVTPPADTKESTAPNLNPPIVPDLNVIQNNIDQNLKELGQATPAEQPAPQPAETTTGQPAGQTANLPPLPEI